jgi:hypothetical protein
VVGFENGRRRLRSIPAEKHNNPIPIGEVKALDLLALKVFKHWSIHGSSLRLLNHVPGISPPVDTVI